MEDAKLGLKEPGAREKIAIVSDKDWLKRSVRAPGWMMPGEVRLFDVVELRDAKEWAAS